MNTKIKVVIDFSIDPTVNPDAEQVVYINGNYEPIDTENIIGKHITAIELDENTKCLILTLEEELPEIEEENNEK
jgi:hypothetical protein